MKKGAVKTMARMMTLVRPLAGYMCLAVISGVCGHICAAGITVSGGYAMLSIIGDADVTLRAVFTVLLISAVLRAVFRCSEQYLNHYIAFTLLALIRGRVFGALRKLCPAKLEGRDKGDLISVITSDIELLEVFYAHTVSPVCIAVIFTAISVTFISVQSVMLGIIALAGYAVVGAAVPVMIFRISGGSAERYRGQSGKLSAFVLENLRGLDEIIQYSAGKRKTGELRLRGDSLAQVQEKMSRSAGLNSAITGAAVLISDMVMLFSAAALYSGGSISFSQAVLAVTCMMSGFGPVIALADLGSVLQSTIASGERVLDILDESPVTEDITDGCDIRFSGAQAEGVVFSYGGERVLDGFGAVIEKGSITGITGRSGSGKSTFLKLLMRFWRAESGRIEISGEDINGINTASLRDNESYVTQETLLFRGTIEYNIKIAKHDATREEVEEACKKASIHDFIMTLPEGYQTQVGELGETLSGGERQRIGLARAFLHDSPLMLLDEPTSNLDSLNEAVILRSVLDKGSDKTAVIVSHRASTLRICGTTVSVER